MAEEFVFNGAVYRRYPDSTHASHRRYFNRSGGKGLLHRDVWSYHNGPVPEGFHVHHIDGDCSNNSIENLECIPATDHFAIHTEDRRAHGLSDDNLKHMESMREKAKDWHSSPEGLAWHKEVSSQYLEVARKALQKKREEQAANPKTVTCVECGELFSSPTGRARVCSHACHSKRSRRRKRQQSTAIESE